ncbi:DUF1987 domain-containing protein [Desulfonema ishimotonii]|uniref:DUF1987 domain-containing protein n=1 Tax=Desulfonema ishimotonii TaxID=45657 RepID=A0A401FVP7_9BACT|nr:DUF1987 domain-containing protein [Desulfonema ishimotonii]GBC61029.1 DUF1987 domain-containing protein [Desulfonema ishimotonii]
MENLKIEATKYTPEIVFDYENHHLEIKGKSYPENTSAFYRPVFDWLEAYLDRDDIRAVSVSLWLIYFNSSSSKALLDFFDMLEEASEDGKEITVNWIYEPEDEDSLEFGEEFQEDFETLNFNMVAKSS